MSMCIVNNAGTLERAGFSFLKDKKDLDMPVDRVNLIQRLNPFISFPGFSARAELLSGGNSSFYTIYEDSPIVTICSFPFYWPTPKSTSDWRGGRRALQ